MVSHDQVQKIAKLSKITISDDDMPRFTKDLESILSFFEILNEVNTDNVEPTSQVTGLLNADRPDVIEMCPYEKQLVECTPHEVENNSVKIPKIM